MSELQVALAVGAGLITLFSFSFGIFWKIIDNKEKNLTKLIDDNKKSFHARIDRIDTRISDLDLLCGKRKNNVTDHFSDRFDKLHSDIITQFANINGRMDNLIFTLNGGKSEKS